MELLPERAVWWPEARTLLVADLHWGKGETFHAHGIPIPGGVLADDLERLRRALTHTGAERVVVLGDLVHGAVPPSVVEAVAAWRERVPVPMVLVRGNHDRHQAALPRAWAIDDREGCVREGPFSFRHAPEEAPGTYTWAGHLHPMAVIRGRGDALRLPCFHLGVRLGVLPAFSAFTGGVAVRRAPGDRVFVLAEGTVVEVR